MIHKKKVLILAPHTDDGEFGCGATIKRLTENGSEVYYVAFSTCEESVPEGYPKDILAHEVKKATQILGIKPDHLLIQKFSVRKFPEHRQEILEYLIQLRNKIKPELIFTPCSFDIHQDHSVINQESKRAFKNHCILGYELPWNNFEFAPSFFVNINEEQIQSKIDAINAYDSQKGRVYSAVDNIKTILKLRGMQAGKEWAEAFELIRWIE